MLPSPCPTVSVTRRYRPSGAVQLNALAALVLGAALLYGLDVRWHGASQQAEQQRDTMAANEVGAVLTDRLTSFARLPAGLAAMLETVRSDEPAWMQDLTTALLRQGPTWVETLAIVDPRDGQALAMAQNAISVPPGRLRQADLLALYKDSVPTVHLLQDGRLVALCPLKLQDPRPVLAVAVAPRREIFQAFGDVGYVVWQRRSDGGGGIQHPVYRRGGSGMANGVQAAAYRRTLRAGAHPWLVDIYPPRSEAGHERALALGCGVLLVLCLAAWFGLNARRRRDAQATARLYRGLFEVASELTLVLDERLRVVRANTEAERLLAICHPEDYGKPFIDHLAPQVREDAYARLLEALRGQPASFVGALPARPERFFRFRVAPLRVDGELTGLQLLGEDVTDRLRLERELAQRQRELEVVNHQLFMASVTDDLTGVFNRGHLTERAQIEVERAKRYGRPLTCLFLDLDHFKRVNDTWGHAAGDRVLKHFARMLAEHLRSSDLVGRYGGEEFVVILTDTDALSVHAIAEKIRNLTRSAHFEDVSPDCRITVSMGAASLGRGGVNDLESLFSAADAALYEAKNSGRDRVVYHCSMAA